MQRAALKILSLLLVASFASPSLAEDDIDFSKSDAIGQWLSTGGKQPEGTGVSSIFYNAAPVAFDRVIIQGTEWNVKAVANYSGEFAVPPSYEHVIVNGRTFEKKFLLTGGYAFLENKANPEVRLVVLVTSSYASSYAIVYFNRNKGTEPQASKVAAALEASFTESPQYRSSVVEFTPTGVFKHLPGVQGSPIDWDSFIFDAGEKTKIQKTIEDFIANYNRDLFHELKLPMSRGVLLFGPPGTGKSHIAKILVSKVLHGAFPKTLPTFFYVSARHVSDVQAIRSIYNVARQLSPAIIFIEDVDLIAGTNRAHRQEVKNELMQQLSGIEALEGVLTIATTNLGHQIDGALLRSQRLGYHFEIGTPTLDSRLELLQMFTRKVDTTRLDLSKYLSTTENMTGADLKEVVRVAIEKAARSNSYSLEGKILLLQDHMAGALNDRKLTKVQPK